MDLWGGTYPGLPPSDKTLPIAIIKEKYENPRMYKSTKQNGVLYLVCTYSPCMDNKMASHQL